jgi:hypothetical protein
MAFFWPLFRKAQLCGVFGIKWPVAHREYRVTLLAQLFTDYTSLY